jgi:hypothetical protein
LLLKNLVLLNGFYIVFAFQLRNLVLLVRQRGKQRERRNSTDSIETSSSSEEGHLRVGLLQNILQVKH